MLIIRKEQMVAFDADLDRRFVQEIVGHVREHFPDIAANIGNEEVSPFVERSIHVARSYQLTSRRDLCRFVNLTATYGADFLDGAENEWMRRILTDAQITAPETRLQHLVEECMGRHALELMNQRMREDFARLQEEDE